MTNRSKSGKRGKGLRYLDLSFEGSEKPAPSREGPVHKPLTGTTNSSFRPHGGYRGVKKPPANQFSFNNPKDYQKQLHDDIDRLLEEEIQERASSPSWVHQVTNEVCNSGESSLHSSKCSSTNKIEQQHGNFALHEKEPSSRPSSGGNQYYRPNRTHQYLTATELKDSSVNVKLGQPTRTTLLRARQKGSYALRNAYDARREKLKKEEERAEARKALASQMNMFLHELLTMSVPEGESLHSFLTGSRYNRAHYMDSKALAELGIYMPRGNPQACFVVGDSRASSTEPPPGTPESMFTEGSASPVSDVSSSQSPSPQAESHNDHQKEPSVGESIDDDDRNTGIQIIEEVLDLDGKLNVKGIGYGGGRSKSARAIRAQQNLMEQRPASVPRRGLPAVQIQGTSFSRMSVPKPSPVEHDLHLVVATSPIAPMSPTPPNRRGPVTVKDVSQKLDSDELSKKGNVPQLPNLSSQENKTKAMEDKSVNVDLGHAVSTESENIEPQKNQPLVDENEMQSKPDPQTDPSGQQEGATAETTQPIIKKDRAPSAKSAKKSRVRFADELGQGDLKEDNVKFFLTEDGDPKAVANNGGGSEEGKKDDRYDSGIESDAGTDSRDLITNDSEEVQGLDLAEGGAESDQVKDSGDLELASVNSEEDASSDAGIISVDITAKPSVS